MRRSIYAKFVLALAGALLLATTLGGVIIAQQRLASARAEQAARVGGQVGRIASTIAEASRPEDAQVARRLLSLLLFDPAIVCAEIVDKAGAIVGVRAPAHLGCRGAAMQETVAAPIPGRGLELRAGVSNGELDQIRREVVWSVALLGALAVVYATLAAYVVFRRVVGAPIASILDSIAQFTRTGAHKTITFAAHDELGDVIDAINAMQKRLEQDAAALRDANDFLRQMALTDALTGLPNRAALAARGAHYCSGALPSPTAALLIDVDSFKEINDRLGHAAGDDVLRHTAQRLQQASGDGVFVARLGGDEFVILLDGHAGRTICMELTGRIEAAFLKPMNASGNMLMVRLSVGMALAGEAETDAEALIAAADEKMYEVKRRAREARAKPHALGESGRAA
ncbi:MAG: diguanylate cyclase [Rhodoblastus sp.]|nr:diguanylate cyclase [Rhodoblastus sp.]MCO5086737.1 diguanylate cyclase [Methylobacteriaceae bacterium]